MLLILEQTNDIIRRLSENFLIKRHIYLTTAESCTGGLIAAACTDFSGSSRWFDRGFVTYSNAAKTEMLGVDAALIARFGAVSEEVAAAQVSVAVTGVAGPTGGSVEKPVGTIWIAWCVNNQATAQLCHFEGDRTTVRALTVQQALQGLIERLI
jgi:nicotinamide-nucleotide amidase